MSGLRKGFVPPWSWGWARREAELGVGLAQNARQGVVLCGLDGGLTKHRRDKSPSDLVRLPFHRRRDRVSEGRGRNDLGRREQPDSDTGLLLPGHSSSFQGVPGTSRLSWLRRVKPLAQALGLSYSPCAFVLDQLLRGHDLRIRRRGGRSLPVRDSGSWAGQPSDDRRLGEPPGISFPLGRQAGGCPRWTGAPQSPLRRAAGAGPGSLEGHGPLDVHMLSTCVTLTGLFIPSNPSFLLVTVVAVPSMPMRALLIAAVKLWLRSFVFRV